MVTERPAWKKPAIRMTAALLAAAGVSLAVMSCRMIDAAAVRLTEPRRCNLGSDARQLADHPEAEGMRVRKHTVTAADGIRLPLLVMDMYEHSYQMDYGAATARYVDAFFRNIQWDAVQSRMEKALRLA